MYKLITGMKFSLST